MHDPYSVREEFWGPWSRVLRSNSPLTKILGAPVDGELMNDTERPFGDGRRNEGSLPLTSAPAGTTPDVVGARASKDVGFRGPRRPLGRITGDRDNGGGGEGVLEGVEDGMTFLPFRHRGPECGDSRRC